MTARSVATREQVTAAVGRTTVWPVDLHPGPAFLPVGELVATGLAARICARIGGPPRRVGESAVVMGVASRLWSATVVTAARDGVLVDPGCLVASDDAGALTLGLADPRGWLDPSPDDVHEAVLQVLAPLVAGLDLAARLLWGNVAASLHAVPRVHSLPQASPLVADLLGRDPYAGELDELPGGRARRRTCCLFYLAPGAGLCGDCVLDSPPRQAPRRPADPML